MDDFLADLGTITGTTLGPPLGPIPEGGEPPFNKGMPRRTVRELLDARKDLPPLRSPATETTRV